MLSHGILVSWLLAFAFGCQDNGPLGLVSGAVEDWQIAASSSYPQEWDAGCHERHARLYRENGLGWCAKYKSSSEWLRIDLGIPALVTGIMTQGRGDGAEWVSSYLVSYSLDGFNWNYVADQHDKARVFQGNKDSYSVEHSYLDNPITARFVKIHTHTWVKHPSMRVELLGCQDGRRQLGLPPYGKMTASSVSVFRKGSSCLPEDGHILSSKAWCAKDDGNPGDQWLQVDLGPPALITGFITKGRGDTGRKHWVTRYRVAYSNDTSKEWTYYRDTSNLEQRYMSLNYGENSSYIYASLPNRVAAGGVLEFGGNVDKETSRYHYLTTPFVARYVRFHPMEFNTAIAMRVGILGVPHTGDCGPGFTRVNAESPCVENIAYKKQTWLNNKKHSKRHLGNDEVEADYQAYDKLAAKAVDGASESLKVCTILDSYYDDQPQLTIDLGDRRDVAGVIILMWQGDSSATELSSYGAEYVHSLDSLAVYVAAHQDGDETLCGTVTNSNGDELLRQRLHVPCQSRSKGRYLRVEARGKIDRWSRWFTAVLCEVMVYE